VLLFEQRYGFKNQTFAVELINGGVNDQNATTASDGRPTSMLRTSLELLTVWKSQNI